MPTDADNTVVDNDDLDAFSKEFFGGSKPAEPEVVVEEEVTTDEVDEPVDTPDDEPVVEPEDEDDTEDEDDESEAEEEVEKPRSRNRKTAQERIKELNTRAREAERRELELMERLRKIETTLTSPKEEKAEVKVTASDMPDPDTVDDKGDAKYPLGEFDPGYIRDLTRWTFAQEMAEAQKADAERRETDKVAEARSAAQAEWLDRLDAAKADIPDLEDKVITLADHFADIKPEYGDYLVGVIQSLENGPYVLDYLADNPKEAQKIVSSGATAATVALGRLDIKVSKPEAELVVEKVVKVSNAPEPAAKTTRGTGARFAVSPDTDDLEAFSKMYFKK